MNLRNRRSNQFGGSWTEQKLNILEKYFQAYLTIMKSNKRAQYFRTIYLDGFAGSGTRYTHAQQPNNQIPLVDFQEQEIAAFYKGSVHRALNLEKSFDQYIFVEKNHDYVQELKEIREKFPRRDITIIESDINQFIDEWVRKLKPSDRALVFLDPYGLQVKWPTLEALAQTQKVDLWILIPLGQAILRLLSKKQPPPEEWARALADFFGTEEWKNFYGQSSQLPLFGENKTLKRTSDLKKITQFIVERLQGVFTEVLNTPVILYNSKRNPLYLLCFAASNPKGAPTAVKIARDIVVKDFNIAQSQEWEKLNDGTEQ